VIPFETTLGETLERQARERPSDIAFAFSDGVEIPGRQRSFAAFGATVRALAGTLGAIAAPGERVLIVCEPGETYTTTLWACFVAGLIAVPVYPPDPSSPASLETIRAIVADAAVAAVIVPEALRELIAALAPSAAVVSADGALLVTDGSDGWGVPEVVPEAPALLLYTSGSTGMPKAVVLTHRNLLHNARVMAAQTGVTTEDRTCVWLPPYHVSGLFSGLVMPVAAGCAALLFSPFQFAAAPVRWLRAMTAFGATMSGSPTFAYEFCALAVADEELVGVDLSAWRVAVVGGEAVRPEALARFSARFAGVGFRPEAFFAMFGLTECTMIATGDSRAMAPVHRVLSREGLEAHVARSPQGSEEAMTQIESGTALPEMWVAIADPATGRRRDDNLVGEIWVAGASVSPGYWRRPELTAATFGQVLPDDPQRAFLRTGDLGFMRDGVLTVTGRLKEMIIIRGLNHYPEDLERTAKALDAQLAATGGVAAFGVRGADGEEQLVLAVELAAGIDREERAALYGRLREAIARDHGVQVAGFAAVPAFGLPRTPTRKIQRGRCREAVERGEWPLEGDIVMQLSRPWPGYLDHGSDEPVAVTDYIAELVAIAAGHPPSDAEPDGPLAAWGLDSLVMVRLAVHLEHELARPVSVTTLLEAETPRDLASAILHTGPAADPLDGLDSRLESDPGIYAAGVASLPPAPAVPRHWLLTGATGFLGRRLLVELLATPDTVVTCLVRGKSSAHARERVLAHVPVSLAERVEVLAGDLAAPRFGLPEADWTALAARVDAVVLNGASINFVAPYAQLRPGNVEAVRTGITLATTTVRKPVHFVSTLGVFNAAGRERFPALTESARPDDLRDVFGGYAQSKWVAEMMLERAAGAGLPVSVYRPGLIGGDGDTGEANLDDFAARLIRGCVELGAYPDIDVKLEWVPVDFVAAALVAIANQGPANTGTFHLVNPAPVPAPAVFEALAERGHVLRAVSLADWLGELAAAPPSNALYPLLPFLAERGTRARLTFLELFARGPCPGFTSGAASAALAGSGVTCPPLDGALLTTYLDHFERVGWLPPVATPA
jgi:thioester reductase-like protein